MVYSFDGTRIERLHSESFEYSEMLFIDIDQNNVNEMLLCTKGGERSPALRLMRFRAGRMDTVGEVALKNGIKQYARIQFGSLTTGLQAVFADVLMENNTVETLIAAVEGSNLVEIRSDELGIQEQIKRPFPSLYCADVNGDGLIDIPVMSILPA